MAQLKSTSITGDLSVSGKITGTFGGLTASRALVTNSSGNVAVSAVTSTELGYLDGVTSAIQTQLNGKAASSHTHNYAGSDSAGGVATNAYTASKAASLYSVRTLDGDSHALALKREFDNNKSSIVRNSLLTYYSGAYGNGSQYMGYFLPGYDTTPYGGFYVAHYDTPYYVGISYGGYNQQLILTSSNYSTYVAPASHTHNYAAASHGNHVPTTQTANNAKFLRNDNTWQTVTPSNIGLKYTNILANGSSSSSISWSSGAYDFIVGISRPNASNTPCQFVIPVGFTGDVQIADDATYSIFTISATSMTYKSGNNAKIICAWGVNVV